MAEEQDVAARAGAAAPVVSAREPEATLGRAPARGVTARSFVLALVLIPLNSFWIMQMEIVRYSGHPTTISLFFNVIFTLLALLIGNAVLRRLRPAWALTQAELLTVYVMLTITSALCGHDQIQVLASLIPHVYWGATPENKWATDIVPHIPEWLGWGTDVAAVRRQLRPFYIGNSTLYTPEHLLFWARPVLIWCGFILLLGWMMFCINTLVRKRWMESERLTYPIVQLPIELTEPSGHLFRNRLMWIGFALAACITVINGLNYWFPSLPMVQVRVKDLMPLMTEKPWNAMRGFQISFYPFAIGLGMLLPVDLLFSCWFFYFFWKAQFIFTNLFGLDADPQFPYPNQQAFGGYIGIALFALWMSRPHLRRVARHILGRPSGLDDSREPLSYRMAAAGLVTGAVILFAFCLAAGMSPGVIVAFFIIFFALSLAVTRMRAELGPPAHDLHNGGPDVLIQNWVGTPNLGRENMTMFSYFFWFNRAYRSHPMPMLLEGMKIADRQQISQRGMGAVMVFALGFGALCSFWAFLHLMYSFGASGKVVGPVAWAFGPEPWNRMAGWIAQTRPQPREPMFASVLGTVFTLFLMGMRMRFFWWPFHPVGYAVSSSWSMNILWLPLFIAWVVKLLLLRYGGLTAYTRALPFFYGLILGEFTVGSLWTLIGIAFNVPSYGFWV